MPDPEQVEKLLEDHVPRTAKDPNEVIVQVGYATLRGRSGSSAPNRYYGRKRIVGSEPLYGIADVSIPPDHRMGHLERPTIWRCEIQEHPTRHVILRALREKSPAAIRLSTEVDRALGEA